MISACVCLQVFSRYVLNLGLVWTEDVAMFAMTWAVYFGAAMAVHEKFHVRMMAAVMILPFRIAWFITFLSDLVFAAFLVFMMIYDGSIWRCYGGSSPSSPRSTWMPSGSRPSSFWAMVSCCFG